MRGTTRHIEVRNKKLNEDPFKKWFSINSRWCITYELTGGLVVATPNPNPACRS